MEQLAVIFGEVLFDRFPDSHTVLGGAPFNVAWHLQGFGFSPLLVSCVGLDAEGDQVLSTMAAWGMDTRGIQRTLHYPTGTVQVTITQGQPSFDILADQAYDNIQADVMQAVLGDDPVDMVYIGTLGSRGAISRAAARRLLQQSKAPVFVDVNLRDPWWDAELLGQVMGDATWAKLNDQELIRVSGQQLTSAEYITAAEEMRRRYSLTLLVLTMGADGAAFVDVEGVEIGAPVPVPTLVDTVGAGDAFSAVTMLGLIHHWPLSITLQRALQFASRICGQQGATAMNPDLYQEFSEQWAT